MTKVKELIKNENLNYKKVQVKSHTILQVILIIYQNVIKYC